MSRGLWGCEIPVDSNECHEKLELAVDYLSTKIQMTIAAHKRSEIAIPILMPLIALGGSSPTKTSCFRPLRLANRVPRPSSTSSHETPLLSEPTYP
jgi:hypothetical protein